MVEWRSSCVRVASVCALAAFAASARAAPGSAPSSSGASSAPTGKPALVPPRLVSAPDVPYPEGGEGAATVVLRLVVDETGAVSEVAVESGEEPFASAAAAGAKSFRFDPATRDGTPIPARIRYQLSFAPPAPVEPETKEPQPAPVTPTPKSNPAAPITKGPESPAEIDVVGEKPAPTVSSFSRAEVRELPGAFGDPFRAIESLPGVTPIVSGLPFFYVRGAPPGNVGYYLDGVRVPYLYHVGLGPSVVHPGMVDRVDRIPAGIRRASGATRAASCRARRRRPMRARTARGTSASSTRGRSSRPGSRAAGAPRSSAVATRTPRSSCRRSRRTPCSTTAISRRA